MASPQRRIVFGIIVGIIVAIVVLVGLAGVWWMLRPTAPDGFEPAEFDSAVWKATPSEFSHQSMRLRMVDDFLDTHNPVGKTRDAVVMQLGQPDDTPYFDEYDMVYHLGAERRFISIDSEWLVLKVDDSGVVTVAELVTD